MELRRPQTGAPATTGDERWYPQLLRKPGVGVMQCLASVVVLGFLVLVVQVGLSLFEVVLFGGFGYLMGVQQDGSYGGPLPVLYGILLKLLYVGFAALTVALAFGVRPGWICSVRARLRWRVALAVLPALAVAAVVTWAGTLVEGSRLVPDAGAAGSAGGSQAGWVVAGVVLAVVAALLDEVLFRGWLAQTAGAALSDPRAALVLSAAVSTAAFAWWRSPEGPVQTVCVLLLGLTLFAVVTLTGGLEAAVAIAIGIGLAIIVPYAAVHGLDVASGPRAASWADVVGAAAGGAVAVAAARMAGAQSRGQPEGPMRSLSDLSQLRGAR